MCSVDFHSNNNLVQRKCTFLAKRLTSFTSNNIDQQNILCPKLDSIIHETIRYKSNKRQRRNKNEEQTDDEDEDEDSDDDLSEFKEGNKSDANIVQIQIPSLRLDSIIKASLNISKR